MIPPILVGITGGSGSGKSWLARAIRTRFGEKQVTHIELDWYYRDLSHLDPKEAARTDFDAPEALELDLLQRHLKALLRGETVAAPQYAFSSFSRKATTRALLPTPIVVIEGLFALHLEELRDLYQLSVFVDTPADVRLIRRIRRDLEERGYELERILQFWERNAIPSFDRFVLPQREFTSYVWESLADKAFVPKFLADLQIRLARNATRPTPTR
ncbi:uridine kinase [Pelagicoccus sp. SDUM812003]|uniref:uridine kinase n=1 Tax=Pelagicoccus sp. SDUM812003 TaxID=3041267 RepID=UPI00280F80A0|nr:uridine kinase [Pelagicoccus sp. SDUM812003]MDQ8203434.1 uridine kinase [Pelagicoccus sp. SDUM812003]